MDKRFCCDLPYPPVEVTCPDPACVPILRDLYAGQRSELGAITQYCYQSFLLGLRDEDLSDMLRGIAIVEMHHLEMLGKLILLCGGSPVFAGGRRRWWSGSFPNYCRNPRGAVQASLRDEMDAVGAYQAAASSIRDPKIQAVLRRIAMDEEHHVKLLQEMLQRPCCRR